MVRKLIIVFCLLLLAFGLKADEFDDFLAKLEAYQNGLAKNYKKVITSQQNYNINKLFALASVDHKALAIGLHIKAREDLKKISEIATEFELLKSQLSQNPGHVNALSVQFFTLLTEAKRRLRNSEDYQRDLLILQESWDSYCNEDRLKYLDRFFKPLAQFSPNQDVGFLSAPKSPNGVSVTASFSGNGDMNSFYTGQRPGASEKENENWQIAAGGVAVAAGAVCAYFTLGVAAQACATYGYFAVMALKLITDVVRFAGDNKKYAERVSKQSAIRQNIYDIQLNAIKELESETDGLVKKSCEERFVAGQTWPIDQVNELITESRQTFKALDDFVHEDLAEIRQDHYSYLLNTYFPGLVDSFLISIKTYYLDREKNNQQAKQYAADKVVVNLKWVKESQSRTEKARWQQELWTDVIKGDAQFLGDNEFSFVEVSSPTGQPTFSNVWKQLGPEVLRRAAQ